MKSLACFLAASCFAMTAAAAEPPSKVAGEFLRPFPIVAIPEKGGDALKAAAKEVADALAIRLVLEQPSNPVCCVWIEITGWLPNPGKGGYLIIHQPGGSLIQASDEEQLAAAIKRLKASIRKRGEGVEVPAGLTTNYQMASDSASPAVDARDTEGE